MPSIIIQLGTSGTYTAIGDGVLIFRINDGYTADNAGSLPLIFDGVLYNCSSLTSTTGPAVVTGQTYVYSCPAGSYWNIHTANLYYFNADGTPRAGNDAPYNAAGGYPKYSTSPGLAPACLAFSLIADLTYIVVSLTATLTAAPAALSLCAPGPSLLSWTTTRAASVSIDNGIGAVALSGSLSVNPLVTTTYTLTATGPGGAVTSTATITVTPYIIDQQLPSVTTGAAAWFGGKRILAAGAYRIRYLGGAYQFDKNKGFAIAGGGSIPNMGGAFSGFHLTDGVTDAPFAPGGSGLYAVPGDAFAASAGAKVVYPHAGGPLGVYLSQQALGYANAAILGTTPVFEIFGPVPTAALSASTNVIRAGQQVTLSWTTVVGAATLDNGIGAVAASGTQSVSPAVTTLYTLSCADPCNTATSSTLVTVLPPGTPPALMTTLSPGTITLTASPPPLSQGLTTIDGYQFLRSATSGSGYAPLGTSLTPTFTDTTASLGVPYFYVCRGYSGSQYSGYSPEAPAFLPLAPPAPAGLALRPGSGQVLLAWNAPAAIYGSFGGTSQIAGSPALTASVFRSLAPGGEGATPVKTGISSPFWLDLGLTNGLTYYYTVVFVNVSGSGAASAEVSGVPQSGLGWG